MSIFFFLKCFINGSVREGRPLIVYIKLKSVYNVQKYKNKQIYLENFLQGYPFKLAILELLKNKYYFSSQPIFLLLSTSSIADFFKEKRKIHLLNETGPGKAKCPLKMQFYYGSLRVCGASKSTNNFF